jgi:hypothetical protein
MAPAPLSGPALGVEVVDLLDRERQPVDGFSILLEVVVAHATDHVDVASLAEILGRVLRLRAPQRPQDRGRLLLTRFAAAPAHVADGSELRLGHQTTAAVDLFEPDVASEMRVALNDQHMGHVSLLAIDRPGFQHGP